MAILCLTLVNCTKLKPFPAKTVYEYDDQYKVCGKYSVTIQSDDKIRMKHIEDLPVSACHGIFGFSTKDTPKVTAWVNDAIDYTNKKCK